ncbi:MAG: tRNA uridine-5-carboxymethylaminomethyl(34) synthesis GTPase MnmE [Lachnospiraceae bacterium]|nr:tRNA uridine-5-carboxymethylaminomethyl(34) synthesis GTPase MnmE [Candidatus Minthocola equi]
MIRTDTIAAIASGLTSSGIGIIRISGSDSVCIADKVARPIKGQLHDLPAGSAKYCRIYDGDTFLDEAIVIVMRAPHSYTAEDVVEIQCHGGPYLMQRVLQAVIAAGALPAEPGEFTKRAFFNGRLDLTQSEAVMQLISSSSEYARKAALDALSGTIRAKVSALRGQIIHDTAFLEAAMDDPEHIDAEGYAEELKEHISGAIKELSAMIEGANEGRVLREGIKTVILGSPNVGKSTLLNYLYGSDRAIVTDIPGTTRDTLEEQIRMGQLMLRLIDTAGLRDTEDPVEKAGVDRARSEAKSADLILYVLDGTRKLTEKETEEISALKENVLVLLNKDDGERSISPEDIKKITNAPVISISAKYGKGAEEIQSHIEQLFMANRLENSENYASVTARQQGELIGAKSALETVYDAICEGVSEDLYTVDMMDAYKCLGRITGEEAGDDLADEIFASFCMGK